MTTEPPHQVVIENSGRLVLQPEVPEVDKLSIIDHLNNQNFSYSEQQNLPKSSTPEPPAKKSKLKDRTNGNEDINFETTGPSLSLLATTASSMPQLSPVRNIVEPDNLAQSSTVMNESIIAPTNFYSKTVTENNKQSCSKSLN